MVCEIFSELLPGIINFLTELSKTTFLSISQQSKVTKYVTQIKSWKPPTLPPRPDGELKLVVS